MMLYFKNDLSFHLIEYEDRVRPLMPFFEAIGGRTNGNGKLDSFLYDYLHSDHYGKLNTVDLFDVF